ncbi:hypothetical protein [Mycolicibacterium porcinum]|uniref:Restriction endonuclease n=1 Tax=Mycolicibacterium porcinum TaxID=39693 RepID=A0ABV3VA16_9MYCO
MDALPKPEEILVAAEKAGWLLEQSAVRTLESTGFHPRPSWAFQDIDDPASSRELDVWSYRRFLYDEETKVSVSASVLVECKQSEMPYLAIGHTTPEWRQSGNPTEHMFPVDSLALRKVRPGEPNPHRNVWGVLGFREIAENHGYTDFRATQLTRLDRGKGQWSASNAGIFTSLVYPLAKAIRATQGQLGRTESAIYRRKEARDKGKEITDWAEFVFIFPVILISSPLYVIDAGGEEPTVSDAKWVRAQRDLKSRSVKGLFEFDIVRVDAFLEYIELAVTGFVTAIAAAVGSDPLRHTGEAWIPPDD